MKDLVISAAQLQAVTQRLSECTAPNDVAGVVAVLQQALEMLSSSIPQEIRQPERILFDVHGQPDDWDLTNLLLILYHPGTDARTGNIRLEAFYKALLSNLYHACGEERVEVNGELRRVWAYHTCGWSGNEQIIEVLRTARPLWDMLLLRYDAGGHYYFRHPADIGLEGWHTW